MLKFLFIITGILYLLFAVRCIMRYLTRDKTCPKCGYNKKENKDV